LHAGANPNPLRRPITRLGLAAGVAGIAVAAGVGAASGQSGPGGLGTPPPPKIKSVACATRCLDLDKVAETGTIEISGRGLDSTEFVKFKAADGKLKVEPKDTSDGLVSAVVPVGAETGKVTTISAAGTKTTSPDEIKVAPESAVTDASGFSVESAEAAPRKSFFKGKRESKLDYLFKADGPADVRIDVIDKDSGKVVDSAVEKRQRPFRNHSFTWDGLNDSGKVAHNGDYQFKVSPLAGGPGAGAGFQYYDHIFPLRGKHYYGDGLGAGRGHQGQDVFAKCGTKIVAARGGRVQVNAYQSAAGYYLVIDGAKTGKDYVYMHMEQRGRPKEGSRVRTGDIIGYESDTGDAQGCHLHFELWSAPGWYEGGHVLNPTRPLKKWDKYS
jgi:murein DD-endopeptidase MepM/ murein hydrolase activator NlpD